MPYELSWYVPNQVLYIKAVGHIRDEDIDQLDQEVWQSFNQPFESCTYFVYDATDQTSIPSLKLLSNFKAIQHPRFKWGVVSGSKNPAITFAAQFWSQTARSHVRFFPTVAAGLEFLNRIDESLPPLREI